MMGKPKPEPHDLDVAIVDVEGAVSLCEQIGGRLPTSLEWQKAAIGTDGRLYPWGNEWDFDAGYFFRADGVQSHLRVDAYLRGVSPYGVWSMVGGLPELALSKSGKITSMGCHPKFSSGGTAWLDHLVATAAGLGGWVSVRPALDRWPQRQWQGFGTSSMTNSIASPQNDDLTAAYEQVKALLLLASLNGYTEIKKLLLSSVSSPPENEQLALSYQRRLQRIAEALSAKPGPDNSLRRQIVNDIFQIIRQAPEWQLDDAFEILQFLKNDPQVAQGLLTLIQDDQQNNLGYKAARTIGEFNQIGEDVANGLLQIVEDRQQRNWVRFVAAEALEKLGHVETKGQLLMQIAPDMFAEDNLYFRLALTLKDLGALDKAGELLLNLAKKEPADCIYRSYAVKSFGPLGLSSDTIINELLNLGLDEQVPEQFRVSAADSLAELGQVDAAEQIWLKLAPANQLSPWGREEALKNLQTLGRYEEVVQVWREMAQDKEYPFRYKAAEDLGKAGLPDEAKQLLLDILQDNQQIDYGGSFKNSRILLASVRALGKVGWLEEACDLLRVYAQDKRISQFEVAKTLGALGQKEEAGQLLRRQLQNHKPGRKHIGYDFALTLGKLGQVEQARQLLLSEALDPEPFPDHRVEAARCLGELGFMDEACYLLISLASNRKLANGLRYQAGRALCLPLGQVEQARQVFLNLLQDKQIDKETRVDIIKTLFWESDPIEGEPLVQVVVTELLQFLSDPDLSNRDRSEVAYNLGNLGRGNKLIFTQLFHITSDEQTPVLVRCGAYQGLRNFLGLKTWGVARCSG